MKASHKVMDLVRLGLHSILVHKGRSVLTSLGIIFGVFSVIAMLSINEGAALESERALRELGSDNILIRSVEPPNQESKATAEGRGASVYGVTLRDVARLRDNIPGVMRCVSVHKTQKYAHYLGRNLSVTVLGTEPTYAQAARTDVVAGRFLTASDVLLSKPYCVITRSLARRLFGYLDPLGDTFRLAGEPFVVVGVLSQLPSSLSGQDIDVDNCVIIPISTDRTRFGEYEVMWGQGGSRMEKVDVHQVILQMEGEKQVLDGAAIARSLLGRYHDQPDFEVTVPLELLEQRQKQRRLWNIMFLAIASVSLLVGGIGIMNIMLASVTERTREIGIRRALGAKRRDIIAQFLVEAVSLTTAGGLIGIATGMLIPMGIERALSVPAVISIQTLFWPFLMAVSVGLASGVYPAFRAARLDPIEALRHE
ncbi:MAG TPA: hypothetical protein DCX07_02940 [Phycisphaerales bacterium]|nr:hypothetical protein [Phycisphaerales bacterium]